MPSTLYKQSSVQLPSSNNGQCCLMRQKELEHFAANISPKKILPEANTHAASIIDLKRLCRDAHGIFYG